jgi:hypothetical protein
MLHLGTQRSAYHTRETGGYIVTKYFVTDVWTASRVYEVEATSGDEAMKIIEDQADFDVDAEQSGTTFREIRKRRQHLDRFQEIDI